MPVSCGPCSGLPATLAPCMRTYKAGVDLVECFPRIPAIVEDVQDANTIEHWYKRFFWTGYGLPEAMGNFDERRQHLIHHLTHKMAAFARRLGWRIEGEVDTMVHEVFDDGNRIGTTVYLILQKPKST